jgi:hypothetical protein
MRDRFTRRLGDAKTNPIMRRTAPLAAVLMTLAVVVPSASAKTVTLHYFSKQTSSTFVNPQGQPIGPTTPPAVGDINDNTGIDYAGNHKHHAKKATASDHLRCTITSFTATAGKATCDGQIAIGGSMLLANDVPFTLSNTGAPDVVSINGGTGIYHHAHGKIIATNVGNNTDFTITVTY